MRPGYASRLQSLGTFVSRGHAGGRYRTTLFANPLATGAWRQPGHRMPAGALFVEANSDRDHGRPGPLLVMQKRSAGYDPGDGDWYYAVAGSAARHLWRQGRLRDCSGCHAMAPGDHVFFPAGLTLHN